MSTKPGAAHFDRALKRADELVQNGAERVEIWVAKGVYTTPIDVNDARKSSFKMVPKVDLYGGFAGSEATKRGRSRQTIALNETVLSGELGDAGPGDNAYHVVIGASDARLDGFTVRGGNAN